MGEAAATALRGAIVRIYCCPTAAKGPQRLDRSFHLLLLQVFIGHARQDSNLRPSREVLAVEVAGTEKGAAYASLLRGLLYRGLSGVRLVVSEDHEGIKTAVASELPGVQWQRCVVHFQRNALVHVPNSWMGEVAEDLKAIFKVRLQ